MNNEYRISNLGTRNQKPGTRNQKPGTRNQEPETNMITFIPHQQIDKQKWDECIAGSPSGRIYAYSWFLDRICPGWNALVEDDYHAVFPLTWGRKFSISYLYQPFFCQQLGVFSRTPPGVEKVDAFLSAIPGTYRLIDICLNSSNNFGTNRFQSFTNKTYELNLSNQYEDLYRRYADNTRRNIKKAVTHNVTIIYENRLEELIAMFRSNQGKFYPKIKTIHYSRLKSIMLEGVKREKGITYLALDPDGVITAGAYFLHSNRRYVFLFSGNLPESRENGAMFQLVDRFIRDHAGEDNLLDFMGSNRESLARFYAGFGAGEVAYQGIISNRLPWLVRWVKG